MKKLNKKSIITCIIVAVLIVAIIIGVFKIFEKDATSDTPKEVVDNMSDYGYYLRDDATDYYKELYSSLKTLLKDKEYDEKEYAKLVSQLFVADLFNIDNKLSSSDVGGKQFVFESFKSDFTKIIQDSLYNNVDSNIDGKREQLLPIVLLVSVIDVKQQEFSYTIENKEVTDDKAYRINVSIEYKEDLDYPKSYNVILVHNNNKLEVAKAFGD